MKPLRASVLGLAGWALFVLGAPAGAAPQWCPPGPGGGGFGAPAGSGPSVGGNPGAGPAIPSTGGSPYLANPRGPTSRSELEIQWDYPVFQAKVEEVEDGRSRAVQAKVALAVEDAFTYIAKDDPRPLLVLRECLTCTGTDDALLTKQADNEKTMLMSRWFHCVKLSPSVIEENDAFANLFAGDDPAHLFVARADGSGRIDLAGDQSRTELWDSMEALLASEYKDKPARSLKNLLKLLDQYDLVDLEIARLEEKLDDVIEKDGPKSKKVQKIKRELTDLRAEKSDLRARAVEVSELELKKKEKQAQRPAAPEKSS